jgi:pimeloyl-ACP methyl ester carboxylesterase
MQSDAAATVILVPGSCMGAWAWQKVEALLRRRGIPTRAVDLPSVREAPQRLLDLHDDAAAVRSAIGEIRGPVVLCGHSYGGMVITEAGSEHPSVRHLVYLAADMPDETENVWSFAPYGTPEMMDSVVMNDDGTATFDRARTPLFRDCDPEVRRSALERLRPQSLLVANQSPAAVAWREKPSTFVLCTEDETSRRELFEIYARRATHVIELCSDHSPHLSRPEVVADLLERVAREAVSAACRDAAASVMGK